MNNIKIDAFEYVLFKLNEWYKHAYPLEQNNDISVLKALKLLFFISAVDTTTDSTNTLLDNVFDNFVAMPYGHVESDVYTIIKNGQLKGTSINNSKTTISDFNPDNIDAELKNQINISIEKLKGINYDLIKSSSFDLVELSHEWYSWKYYYGKARQNNTFSEMIPSEFIKSEEKIFSIN